MPVRNDPNFRMPNLQRVKEEFYTNPAVWEAMGNKLGSGSLKGNGYHALSHHLKQMAQHWVLQGRRYQPIDEKQEEALGRKINTQPEFQNEILERLIQARLASRNPPFHPGAKK